MANKSKINWWVILAIALGAIALGYVGTGVVKRCTTPPPPSTPIDTIDKHKDPIPLKPEDPHVEIDTLTGKEDTIVNTIPDSIDDPTLPAPEYKKYLSVISSSIQFTSDGGSKSISIKSNVDWRVEGGNDWLTIDKKHGNGDGSLSLRASSNTSSAARTAKVTVYWTNDEGKNQPQTITVKQLGKSEPVLPVERYLEVSNSSLGQYSSNGGKKDIRISSNTDWSITIEGGNWLSVYPKNGKGNKTITFNASSNPSTQERSASVTVTWTDESGVKKTNTFMASQKGAEPTKNYLTVSPSSVQFKSHDAGKQNLNISSNTNWQIEGGGGWLTVSPSSGNGKKTISLNASSNSSTESRTARLTVAWTDQDGKSESKVITVTQPGKAPVPDKYLNVAASSIQYDEKGGKRNVSITSNANWSVSSSGSWLTVNPRSGKGDKSITLSASANTTSSARTANVTVSWMNNDGRSESKTIVVAQQAKPEAVKPNPSQPDNRITKDEVQRIIGKSHEKIPRNCKVIINNTEEEAYWNFCNGIKVNTYSGIVVKDITTDASGNVTIIKVSATVANGNND